MPCAYNMIRPALHYRRASFAAGLKAVGYDLVDRVPSSVSKGDAVIIWNRYGAFDEVARYFESRGGLVFVAENGYLGKSWLQGEWYSLALGHHAGAGQWNRNGGPERWSSLKVYLKPFTNRPSASNLIIGQRGIGESGVASPDRWAEKAKQLYGGRIRKHPGRERPEVPLIEDLQGDCGRVLTWNSSAALIALMEGVPVWYDQKHWIGGLAGKHLSKWKPDGDHSLRDEGARLSVFQSLAWTLWSIDEISSGKAFTSLLEQAK